MIENRTPISFDVRVNVWNGIVKRFKELYGKEWKKELIKESKQHIKSILECDGLYDPG